MSGDIHARAARAERRWAKRGRAPSVRLLSWMSRVHPWAWRVRLDLIVLFNLALGGLCFFLAHVAGPEIIVRTRDFNPSFAAGVLFTSAALVAFGCAVHWAFAVSRSARLREAAHYANRPGLIVATLVFLSFAFWVIAAGISPHVNLKRHPLFGYNIETSIEHRINVERNATPNPQESNPREYWTFRMEPQPRPSETACMRAASDAEAASALRDDYLCSLGASARKANLWRTLAYDSTFQQWRDNEAHVSTGFILANGSVMSFANPPDLAESVVNFASETEPWKSRIAAMKPWERDADILEDPALSRAFAQTTQFDRLVAREVVFGHPGYVPEGLFEGVPEIAPAGQPSRYQRWQAKVRAELMATPAYAEALAAAEDAFQGAGSAPPIFSAPGWDDVRKTRAHMLATFHMTGEVSDTTMRLRIEALEANWLAQGAALERNPVVRSAFVNSSAYAEWEDWYLYALVNEGGFGEQIRALQPYAPIAAYWRATLLREPAAPEAELLSEIFSDDEGFWFIAGPVALILALLLVSLTRMGLGATFGALAVHAILALLLFNAILIASYQPIGLRTLTLRGIALAILLAPLVAIAFFLVRGVRGRRTPFLAATAIWGVVIWLLLALPLPDLIAIPVQNPFVSSLVSFAFYAFTIIAVAELILAMNARIVRFPRTS